MSVAACVRLSIESRPRQPARARLADARSGEGARRGACLIEGFRSPSAFVSTAEREEARAGFVVVTLYSAVRVDSNGLYIRPITVVGLGYVRRPVNSITKLCCFVNDCECRTIVE